MPPAEWGFSPYAPAGSGSSTGRRSLVRSSNLNTPDPVRSKGVDEGMSVEQNLRMVEAAFEAINDQDWDHLWGLHVDNIVIVGAGLAGSGQRSRGGPGTASGVGRGPSGSLVEARARFWTGRLGVHRTRHLGNAQRAAPPWPRPADAGKGP